MLIPMGRSEDIRLALRRREQREMKDKKSNVANLLEAQWVRGKDREATGEPRAAIQKGGNAVMYTNDARCVGIGGSAFP